MEARCQMTTNQVDYVGGKSENGKFCREIVEDVCNIVFVNCSTDTVSFLTLLI